MTDLVTQADAHFKRPSKGHQFIKRKKRRAERRKARVNPEATPGYGKYRGYET